MLHVLRLCVHHNWDIQKETTMNPNYAKLYEALCKVPAHKDKTPSEIAMIARELADSGCIVDHEGDIMTPDGGTYWPQNNERTGSIGMGDEPIFG